jgi:lysozyme family protein
MTNRFDVCLPYTLAQECPYPDDWSNPENFSDNAHDPGGETMCGIIQREYDAFRKQHGLEPRDVRFITRQEGLEIYETNYWLSHSPDLPPGLDLSFFDASVNEGSTESVRMLQYALGIQDDGEWGPETAAAVAAIKDPSAIVQAFTARRCAVYREMRGFPYFGTDWLRRSDEIGATALKMATAAAT